MPYSYSRSRRSSQLRLLNGAASALVLGLVASPGAIAQSVISDGENVTRTSAADGDIFVVEAGSTSEVSGAPVVIFDNNNVTLNNAGTLRTLGVTNTVQINENAANGIVNNAASGVLEAESRVIDIQGDGAVVNNEGIIRGIGNQRNGAVYANRTANDFTVNNIGAASVIDAGLGNNGAGVSIELGGGGAPITGSINNEGVIQGRGQDAAPANTAGDGIRFFGPGLAPTYNFAGDITNSGLIASESAVGPVAGIRFSNNNEFAGTLTNEATGIISGVNNGVYFGEADHTGGVVNNAGTISSDSRAFNLDGTGLVVNNDGDIVGTGNQRNGTFYADGTADGFTVNNLAEGVIDAGEGNEGSGFGAEVGGAADGANTFTLINDGAIQGRGNAAAGANAAGDGVRIGNVGNIGIAELTATNTGLIDSEGANGTVAGVRFVNGVSFAGTFDNSGTISGVQNGVYFGNPVVGDGADHSNGVFNNLVGGVISSASRAFNIDGIGLTVNNSGAILGTGNQRNGTVYADSTAQGFALNNIAGGVIDAGAGNEGAGFSVELSTAGNNFTINNAGDILGRGNAGAGLATAGDGLRFERARVAGALDGTTTGLFTGDIVNSGTISSEGANGTAAGIRFVNGVSFNGTIGNSGTITGVQNGLYFGNATPAGGGDFTGAVVNNSGTISSGSRALNIDGLGLTVNNSGQILGLSDQRNGTVYSDATANAYAFNNLVGGLVDAGTGNAGSGVSLQSGNLDGETVTFSVTNAGTIAGRGGALPSGASAGLRVFNGAANVIVDGVIDNSGDITSETAAAILIENVDFTGTITNSGNLTGATAFDASTALGGVDFVQAGGALNGDFVGSSFADTLTISGGVINGSILGGVATTIADGGSATITGEQSLEGDLITNGALNFVLGADSLAVAGDTTFGANSVVNIATPDDVTQIALGAPISVISETGAFTDNGLTVNVADDDFLVDYVVGLGSVNVTPTAVDLAAVSPDANVSAFGGALTSAFSTGQLDAGVANALNNLTDAAGFEAAAVGLLPALNEGVTREIFETQGAASNFINRRLAGEGVGVWGQALYRTARRDAESVSVAEYNANSFGFAFGADTRLSDNLTVGAAFNYASIDVNTDGAGQEGADIDSYQISGYAGYDTGRAYVNGQVGYTFNSVEAARTSIVGPVLSDFDVNGFTAQANAGVDLVDGSFKVTPQAGIRYANLSQDAYTESSSLNLGVDAEDVSFLDLKAGVEVSTSTKNSGWSLRPVVRAAYVYDAIGDARILNASFAGATSPFVLSSGEPAQSRVEYGAGLEASGANGWSFSIEYDGETAADYQAHGGFVRARFNF